VRLVEFLIYVLEAHAETLKRLAALLGEENLVQLLEMAGDDETPSQAGPPTAHAEIVRLHDFEAPAPGSPSSPYAELEGSVQDMNLPAVLQFHLWAYPHYRAFIESPVDLNARIPGPGPGQNNEVGLVLVDEAVAQAEVWVKKLPVTELVSQQVLRTAHVPWLRFRTGRRPLGPVY
jgi:hypothetical protein